MSAPTYSNGKTPQPGDLIALNISGSRYPFVVTAVGAPASASSSNRSTPQTLLPPTRALLGSLPTRLR